MLRANAVRWYCFTLLALSVPISAQLHDRAGNDSAKYPLTGTVVNSVTGEPIRRALVQIYSGARQTALTDGNGQFEFDNLAPGQTSINVRKPGFFDERESRHIQVLAPTTATIGPDSFPVLLKLVPESVVYGRILDAAGEPLESLPLKLITAETVEGRKRWQQVNNAGTNEDGEFRMAGIRPGLYYLEVGPGARPGTRNLPSGTAAAYPTLFYPGVSDFASATPFEIAPGQQVNADLSIQSVPIFKVSGYISGMNPDWGVSLEFVDSFRNQFSPGQLFESGTGKFEVMAPAGRYNLLVNSWGPGGAQLNAQISLEISSDISGIRLALVPLNVIPIIVRTETARPSTQSSRPRENQPIPNIRLIEKSDSFFPSEFGSVFARDPKQQSLVLQNVAAGRYSVEINANPLWYVQSAQCGDTDLLREDLVIPSGVQMPPIELVLRDDGATLSGQLHARANSTTPVIVLVPDHGSSIRTEDVFSSSTQIQEFTFTNVQPGDYEVYAFDRPDGIEYRNPDVLSRYSSKAIHVTLQPNEQHKIDLDVIIPTD